MIVDLLKKSDWAFLLDFVSPAFFKVIPPLQLINNATAMAKRTQDKALYQATFVVISLTIASSFINQLPEQLPIHFNTNGRADGYGTKFFALLFLPSISVLTVLFTSTLLRVAPEGYKSEHSAKTVAKLNFGITLFMMMIYLASLREALEPGAWISSAVPVGLSLLTIFLGNYFGKIERNFVVGFRLPWTLTSDDNWKQTHRFAARPFAANGGEKSSFRGILPFLRGRKWPQMAAS